MKKIIAISGHAQNGKDTAAQIFKQEMEKRGLRVVIIHFADLLKLTCKLIYGWDGKKDERGRRLLQYVGTDIVREKWPDFWVSYVCSILALFEQEWDVAIIPDTRFPNEISELRALAMDYDINGLIHIAIKRDNVDGLTEEQMQHPSETSLDEVIPDIVIENNKTIMELKEIITKLTEDICRG